MVDSSIRGETGYLYNILFGIHSNSMMNTEIREFFRAKRGDFQQNCILFRSKFTYLGTTVQSNAYYAQTI